MSRAFAQAQRESQYQQGLDVVEAEESRVRDVVEDWRRMPEVPDRSDVEAALHPRAYAPLPPPALPDLELEGRNVRSELRREFAKEHTKTPLYIALAVMFFIGPGLSAVTKQDWLGVVFSLGALAYIPVWAIRRYLSIFRQSLARWNELERNLRADHQAALLAYEAHEVERKRDWDQMEIERIATMRQLLAGDRDAVDGAVQASLERLDFPFEATCAASAPTSDLAIVAVDLPEMEDVIPEFRYKAFKNGALKEIRRTHQERRHAWRHLVLGIGLQIARTACASSPSIQQVKVGGYTQRRQRSGESEDEWVYELVVDRSFLAGVRPEVVDPSSLLKLANVRVMPTPDGSLKKISPPVWFESLVAA